MKVSIRELFIFLLACVVSSGALAQEVCFQKAKENFSKWRDSNGAALADLAVRYENSSDPNKEIIEYNGMKMPITAALVIESEKYGREADKKLDDEINGAKKCSNQVAIQRGVYDLAREWLGLTTIAPEKATRIDFAELQNGNLWGGKKSLPNEAANTAKKILNPSKWRF